MNTSIEPATTPGSESGRVMVRNAFRGAAAEVGGRFPQAVVEALQFRVQRKDHERQIGVHDSEVDGEIGLHHHQRPVDDAERQQQVV